MLKMEFYNFTNSCVEYSENTTVQADPVVPNDPIVYYGFLILALCSFSVNTVVFCCVLLKYAQRRRKRPILLLTAHFSILAALAPFLNCFATSDFIQIIYFDKSNCQLISYLKTVLYCVYTINILLIVYELLGSFHRDGISTRTVPILRAVGILWIFPAFFSIPWWMILPTSTYDSLNESEDGQFNQTLVKYNDGRKCMPVKALSVISVNLMDNNSYTFTFELCRFVVQYLLVTVCMIAALINVRSKILFLREISNPGRRYQERLERQIRSVRLVYFYFLSVILLWLPTGIVILLRRVLPRLEERNFSAEHRNTVFKKFASFSALTYVSLCPLITMLFIEKRQTWVSLLSRVTARCVRCKSSRTRQNAIRLRHIR